MRLRRDLLDVVSSADGLLTLRTLEPSQVGQLWMGACWIGGLGGATLLIATLAQGSDGSGAALKIAFAIIGLSVVAAIWRWWLLRSGGLMATGETFTLDGAGRLTGARTWNLEGARAVVLERSTKGSRVLVATERCPRGVVIVRWDPQRVRAARVAGALAEQLRVKVEDEVPELEKEQALRCPTCGRQMKARNASRCTVDYCRPCQSFWLDGGEVTLVYGEDAQQVVSGLVAAAPGEVHPCPRDGDTLGPVDLEGVPMLACATCAGFLLTRRARRQLVRLAREAPATTGASRSGEAAGVAVAFGIEALFELLDS